VQVESRHGLIVENHAHATPFIEQVERAKNPWTKYPTIHPTIRGSAKYIFKYINAL
jgi:hypothetical protein